MSHEDLPCPLHPDNIAGWRCQGECKKYLCSKCTSALVGRFSCCTCGGPAQRLSVPRHTKGFTHWVGVALALPLRTFPVFLLFVMLLGTIAFVITSGSANNADVARISTIARTVLVAIYGLIVVDTAAHGAADKGMALRCARSVAAIAFVVAPGLLYAYFVGVPGKAAQHDQAMWLFAGLVIVYVPVALAVGVAEAPFSVLLNPFRMFDCMWRLGRMYLATLLVVGALAAGTFALATESAASIKASIALPFLGDAAAAVPWLWLFTSVGAMIGLLTFVHGNRFGRGGPHDYVDPQYPKMNAEGMRKVVAPTPDTTGHAIAALDPAERADAAKLAEALRGENFSRALKLYEARATWSAASLDDRKLIGLARAARTAKKLELAERLLDEACARGGRAESQAWLALAQLNAEALGKPDKAKAIYQTITSKFAGTDSAKVATKKLES